MERAWYVESESVRGFGNGRKRECGDRLFGIGIKGTDAELNTFGEAEFELKASRDRDLF